MPYAVRTRRAARGLLGSLLVCLPLLAAASEAEDISKLMQKGAYKDALVQADKAMAAKPRDANLRFLKGVLLAQMDRKQEAVGVFTALTQEFPQLAEPYNNLGVLLASTGDYERAREALQKAAQVSPNYATAHENLGDLYARLATISYDRAAQLDAKNAKARTKLTLARELASAASAAAPPGSGATAVAAAPAKAPAQQAIVVNGASAPVTPVLARALPAAEQAVLESVLAWSKAWSARDVAAYLAAYAPDFQPGEGKSLDAWKAERQARIGGKKEIRVEIQEPKVKLDGNRATVSFMQLYSAGSLNSRDRKELQLIRHGDKWLIQQERVNKA